MSLSLQAQTVINGTTMNGVEVNWTPKFIPGLVGWYHPQGQFDFDTTFSTNSVTTWYDSSGSNNNLTQNTKFRMPTFLPNGTNGFAALQFDGVSMSLQNILAQTGPSNTISQLIRGTNVPYTMFCVYSPNAASVAEQPVAWGNQTNNTETAGFRAMVIDSNAQIRRVTIDGTSDNANLGTVTGTNLFNIVINGYGGVTGSNYIGIANGGNIKGGVLMVPPTNIIFTSFCVGARRGNSIQNIFAGRICEVGAYNRTLGTNEVILLRDFLNRKYRSF